MSSLTNIQSELNTQKTLFTYDSEKLHRAVDEMKDDKEYQYYFTLYNKQQKLESSETTEKVVKFVRHISKLGSVLGVGLLIVGFGSLAFGGLPIFFIPAIVVGATLLVAGLAATLFLVFSNHGIYSPEVLKQKMCNKMLQDKRMQDVFTKDQVVLKDVNDPEFIVVKMQEILGTSEDTDKLEQTQESIDLDFLSRQKQAFECLQSEVLSKKYAVILGEINNPSTITSL